MQHKIKANEIYKSAVFLHGIETAKQEAIKSATATHSLAPFEKKKLWEDIIKELEKK